MKKVLALAFALSLALCVGKAGAVEYPVKQITLVVSAAPGGASDMTSRIYATQLEKLLGKPVIITNKPGASCSIGMEYVKNRRPDGYTLGYIPVESAMIKPLGLTDISSDDFVFFARAMTIPAAITVHKSAPWNTFAEFVEYAKANPGKTKVGNSGTGSIWHISAAAVEEATGVTFNHVPFDGAAPAVAALMGKNIDAIAVSPSEVKSGVDAGEFKVLAILGEERSNVVPDVPTAKELGFDVTTLAWGAFAAPLGTPQEIIDILEKASATALNSAEVKNFFNERGFDWAYLNGKDMKAFADQQLKFYTDLIPKMGLASDKK